MSFKIKNKKRIKSSRKRTTTSAVVQARKRTLKIQTNLKKKLRKNTSIIEQKYIHNRKNTSIINCPTKSHLPSKQRVHIPFDADKYSFSIENAFSEQECKLFISYLYPEKKTTRLQNNSNNNVINAYSSTTTTTATHKKNDQSNVRTASANWKMATSKAISQLMFVRLHSFLPPFWITTTNTHNNTRNTNTTTMTMTTIQIWRLHSLNHNMKSLRYEIGECLCPHFDTPFIVYHNRNHDDQSNHNHNHNHGKAISLHSFLTVVLYLNDDFHGGQFRFLECKQKHLSKAERHRMEQDLDAVDYDTHYKAVDIQTGLVLLFEHEIFHHGCPIIHGTKYLLRSEVMYEKYQELEVQLDVHQKSDSLYCSLL